MRRAVCTCVVFFLLTASPVAGTAAPQHVAVSLDSTTDSFEQNETYQFDLVVENISDTISAYEITVTTTNDTVVAFQGFTPATVNTDGTAVTVTSESIDIVGFNAGISPNDGSATIGTVTVATGPSGPSTLAVDVTTLTNDTAVRYSTESSNTTVTVESETASVPALEGATGPPTNLDSDELLEDVDGDGDGDIFDALTYYNNRNSDVIRSRPALFDYDGSGTAGTIFDTLALYNKIST